VHCDNTEWIKKATAILAHTGAEDISSTTQSSADYAETDRPMPRTVTAAEPVATHGGYSQYEDDFRTHFHQTYANSAVQYEDYSPAYAFGCEAANDPRYRGRAFTEIEPSLQREYEARYPGSRWAKVKDSVRYAWDRLTGRARGAGR
jgi:hypothetical protein